MKKAAPKKAATRSQAISHKTSSSTSSGHARSGKGRNSERVKNAVKQVKGVQSVSRQESKTVSKSQPTKTASKTPARVTFSEPAEVTQQTERFNKAMELFHARELKKARDLFEEAAEGPNREMAFSARMHQRMCEQRLERQQVRLETADDYYNYGVALTNQRRLEEARKHLEQAIKMHDADHYQYALAVCLAMSGKVEEAAERLARAVELAPQTRITVRNDPDFSEYIHHPAIQAVLNSPKPA